jgi:DEAD/DEAH box helicase domain-containing protein
VAKSLLETPWAVAIDPARRDGRIVAESAEEERKAKRVAMPASLDPGFVEALRAAGVDRLYSHQRQALEAAASSNLVITSGTASGKSLAFNLPVLDEIARDSKRRALYLYPTKALAQDQARKLGALRPPGLREAIYDGDTPREERPAIRRRNNLVLTNPDMLHVGLLPHHKSWGDFLANLGWVVVDEAHTYRGVFGSHVANVLRRLRRVARAYGAEPRFLLTSATIANPVELAERLVGEPFELIDDDGAPRTGREIVMWNPPLIDKASGTRRSPLSEAAELLAELVSQDVRTICFLKSRRGIELIQRFARDALAARGCHRRAGAGDRHRRAGRGDLRHLSWDRGQPSADVGAGRTTTAWPGPLRRRSGRARPVLLSPPGRVHWAAGRGGDPRPRKRADRLPPPGRCRIRAAAQRRGRRDLR